VLQGERLAFPSGRGHPSRGETTVSRTARARQGEVTDSLRVGMALRRGSRQLRAAGEVSLRACAVRRAGRTTPPMRLASRTACSSRTTSRTRPTPMHPQPTLLSMPRLATLSFLFPHGHLSSARLHLQVRQQDEFLVVDRETTAFSQTWPPSRTTRTDWTSLAKGRTRTKCCPCVGGFDCVHILRKEG
jgi:hypothetical protein